MGILFTNNTYPFKHWMTSLALSPLIILSEAVVFSQNLQINSDTIGLYMLYVAFGLFFSLPVFIAYLLIFNLLMRTAKSTFLIKMTLNLIAVIGVFITIKLLGGTAMTTSVAVMYSMAIIASSFFYKIKKENTEND